MCNKQITVMKKFFRMVTALSLVAGVLAFTGCTDYEDDINGLSERIDALETGTIASVQEQVKALETSLGSATTAISELNSTVDGIESTLTGLQGDVDALEGEVGDLGTSVSTIEEKIAALESLKGEVEDLATTVEKIKTSLSEDYLTKDEAAATYATAEAVKALEARLGTAEGKLDDFTSDLAELRAGLAALEGKYDSELKISEVIAKIDAAQASADAAKAAADKAQADATTALGEVRSLKEALGVYADAAYIEAALDEKLDIEDFDATFDAALAEALENDGVITEAIAKAIDEAVSVVSAKLDELLGQIPHRLTSLSLIPEFYVDGVETIPVWTMYYNYRSLNAGFSEYVNPTVERDPIILSYQGTEVRYHVSPSGVSNDDIEKPEFVLEKAIELRSAAENNFIEVSDYNIENDELTVTLTKNYDAGVLLPKENNSIYTAALKVPISERNLIEGEETEAYVYSEYYKLTEVYATVEIAELRDINNDGVKEYACVDKNGNHTPYHFSESFDAATLTEPSIAARYNEKLDLLSMVTGCMNGMDGDQYQEITKEKLAELGLEFQFAIPSKEYLIGENKTNQQAFAQVVDGHYLQSTVPGGFTDNRAAVGRQPIVIALLVDTNSGNLVDAAWFKVIWTDQTIPATDLGLIKTFEYELSCNDFSGAMNWEEMNRLILAKIGENGISHELFYDTYRTIKVETKDNRILEDGEVSFILDPEFDNSSVLPTTTVATWTLTVDQIGNVIDKLLAGEKVTYTVDVTIQPDFSDEGQYYAGDIKFQFAVDVVLPALPAVEDYYPVNWDVEGDLLRVYPLQIDDNYWNGANSTAVTKTVEYNYPLNRQFVDVDKNGTFLTNILPTDETPAGAWDCRRWDLQFSASQNGTNNLYLPTFANRTMLLYADEGTSDGYHLLYGNIDAAHIWYTEKGESEAANEAFNWYTNNVDKIELRLPLVDAAKKLLVNNMVTSDAIAKHEAGELTTVTFDIWSRINAHNVYKVETFDVWYVNPLSIDANVEGKFTDAQLGGSKVSIKDAFKKGVLDFVNNEVAVYPGTGDPDRLRQYYDVKAPVWGAEKALVNIDKSTNDIDTSLDANDPADAAKMYLLSETPNDWSVVPEGDYLVFYNRGGAAVTSEDVVIWVPVTVEHKWGTWSEYVPIALKPNSATTGGEE